MLQTRLWVRKCTYCSTYLLGPVVCLVQ